MATSLQSYPRTGPTDGSEEYRRIYSITITQSAFNSTASSNASGGITPKTFRDFGGTFPSSANNGKRLARGGLRWQKLMQIMGTHTNFKVLRIASDSSEAASTQIATLAFNVEFENISYLPTSETSIDNSSLSTPEDVIRDYIATVLNSSFTENVEYYDPTDVDAGSLTIARGAVVDSITASAVSTDALGILNAITVTRIVNADKFRDDEISSGGLQ